MLPARRRHLSDAWQAVLAVVLSSVFLLGIATHYSIIPRMRRPGLRKGKPDYEFPDFDKIVPLRTLDAHDVGLDDPARRFLVIGDVHGMNQSLQRDEPRLAPAAAAPGHRRGRAMRESRFAARIGRASLAKLLAAVSYRPATDTLAFAGDIMAKSTHAGSLAVLDFVTQHACGGAPGRVHAVRGNHDQMVVQWRAWRDWFAALHLDPTAAPAPWVPALAPARRALSRSRADPEKKDPPNVTRERLRAAQERAILHDVPDNRDPWVLLNMRGVRKSGKVTRQNGKGTPWSKVWNREIARCRGFEAGLDGEDGDDGDDGEDGGGGAALSLPCEPASIVYGHAATRGLDVKRWSVGVDTGCLYGRRLTALVLQRQGEDGGLPPWDDDDEDNDDDDEDDEDNDEEEECDDGEEEDDDDDFALQRVPRPTFRAKKPCRPSKAPRKPPKAKTRRITFGDDDARFGAHLYFVLSRVPSRRVAGLVIIHFVAYATAVHVDAGHQCLNVAEIVSHIVSYLSWDPASRSYRDARSLGRLARTCKTLSAPSLDGLWIAQAGVENIVKAMPPDFWSERRETWRWFNREIRPQDWVRFRFYAQRVRIMLLNYSWGSHISDGVLDHEHMTMLGMFAISSPSFPNLRELETAQSTLPVELIPKLLGSKITHFKMALCDSEKMTYAILAHLPVLVPNLRALQLDHSCAQPEDRNGPFSFAGGAIQGLSRLESFKLSAGSTLCFQSFRELISSPRLISLEWTCNRVIDQLITSAPLVSVAFGDQQTLMSSVQDIKIGCNRLTASLRVLGAVKWVNLQYLTVNAVHAGREDLLDLCQRLGDQCSTASLKCIKIQVNEAESVNDLPGSFLRPLYAFRQLESITTNMEYNVMLRDADLMEMAVAWPRLRHLVIDHELFTDTRPCRPATTLSGLLHLVRHCPASVTSP
ncbi:predicted protein [Postia placenta Mad-698-R]|nr:predicted protein [Postia placenta Mad-698-R]